MIPSPGLYPDMTPAEYFQSGKRLTVSGIKILLNETPADYIGKKDQPSAAKRTGDLVHALALGKGKEWIVAPYDDYRTKEAREWRDECLAQGLIPVKEPDYDTACDMAEIVKHRIQRALGGAEYQTEVPFFWHEGDTLCSGMLDVWCPSLAVALDVKVTKYLHGDKARAHIAAMGWDLQSAWYRRGLCAIMPELTGKVRFANLMIHPDEPHTSRMPEISEGWRDAAERDCLRALTIYQQCIATNEWPGYPEHEVLDQPAWLLQARLMREMEEE